jgi:predicted alpha/beta-hydrolase family hydrolase
MQGLFQLFEKLIVLLNLVRIDLIQSPTDSLVSAKQPGAETFPPKWPSKSTIDSSCSQSDQSTYSTFVLIVLQCWKQIELWESGRKMAINKNVRFVVEDAGEVSAILLRSPSAESLLVLAHGAGAGMTHPFMESLATELAAVRVATLRFQFPYMEQKRKIPDRPPVLAATILAAVQTAAKAAPDLPLFAGGKSLGGRMTSLAAAQQKLADDRGLVFFGFPLHPPNQPGTKRAEHLRDIKQPMLFFQGTRDSFADLKLLRPICASLGARATLHVIETADHSFHVLKSSGRTDADVLQELARTTSAWTQKLSRS